MNKKKCIILKIKNFQENKKIINLLTEDSIIRSSLLKSSGKNFKIANIGNFIECRFFGRESSLGFFVFENIIEFGNTCLDSRLNFSILYRSCEIINLFYKESVNLHFDLFSAFFNLMNQVKNTESDFLKIQKYLEFETHLLSFSGWFDLGSINKFTNEISKIIDNEKTISKFKKNNNYKYDPIFESAANYIISILKKSYHQS